MFASNFHRKILFTRPPKGIISKRFNSKKITVNVFYEFPEEVKNIIKPYVEIGNILKQNPSKFHQDLDDTVKNHNESNVILENLQYVSYDYKDSLR